MAPHGVSESQRGPRGRDRFEVGDEIFEVIELHTSHVTGNLRFLQIQCRSLGTTDG